MYRVVIVDDDQLVLNDLKKLVDWEKLGYTIVETFTSAEKTLEAIQNLKPDLLIADVCLGEMNGLDLIGRLRDMNMQMSYLIISAYNEFDYAKRAISSGVIDYLLKTEINAANLTQKLKEIASMLNKEKIEKDTSVEISFAEFMKGGRGYESYPALVSLQREKYIFYVFNRREFITRYPMGDGYGNEARFDSIRDILREIAGTYCARPIVASFDKYVILAMQPDNSIASKSKMLKYFEMQMDIRIRTFSDHYCTYRTKHMYPIELFYDKFWKSAPMLGYLAYFFPHKVLTLEEVAEYPVIQTQYQEDRFPFHRLILDEEHYQENYRVISFYLNELFDSYDIRGIILFYTRFCDFLQISVNNQMVIPERLPTGTKEEFMKWVEEMLYQASHAVANGMTGEYSNAVQIAVGYIQQNYSNSELSLSDVAEAAGLSVNRIGVLFKKELGKTVNEYIAEVRVKKAVELLEKSSMKVYEIAQKCGYKSSQYFSQIVYQKSGKRPIEYRKGVRS